MHALGLTSVVLTKTPLIIFAWIYVHLFKSLHKFAGYFNLLGKLKEINHDANNNNNNNNNKLHGGGTIWTFAESKF